MSDAGTGDTAAPAGRPEAPRVPLLAGQEDGDLSATFAKVEAEAGSVPNLYRALGHAPHLLASWIDYAWTLRADMEVDRGLRELAVMRLAQVAGCDYVWRSHWRPARHFGSSADKLLSLAAWWESDAFSPLERSTLAMADDLAEGRPVGDDAWRAVAGELGDRQALELVLTLAWYANVVRVVTAIGVPLEEGHDRAPAVPGRPEVDR